MKFFSTFSQKYLEVIKKAVSLQRFREIEHIKLNEQMKEIGRASCRERV